MKTPCLPDLFSQGRTEPLPQPEPSRAFQGVTYDAKLDHARLSGQLERIYRYMQDGSWRTLQAISDATGAPHASVSAQLRNLRKKQHGAHQVDRRSRGNGLYEYRLVC